MNQHHSFVIEAEAEKGISIVEEWIARELNISVENNPDVVVLRYGLFSVDDARRVIGIAAQAPFAGEHRVLIIVATRAYHEAQNALLKLFEEPSAGVHLFLILPSLGGLLPTLRSRSQFLSANDQLTKSIVSESAEDFIRASKEKRSAMIKKLTSGKDEEERRRLRDDAIAIINGIEAVTVFHIKNCVSQTYTECMELLSDISVLRGHLYDRSAPVRMILEHLSLVIPKNVL